MLFPQHWRPACNGVCNVIISRFQNQLTLVNFTNVAALCRGKSRLREIFGGRWPPNTHYFLLSSLLSFSSPIKIYLHYPNDHDKVMRYVNLSTLLVYRLVSGKVLAYLCLFLWNITRLYFQQQQKQFLEKHCDHDKLLAGKDEVPNDGLVGRGQASSSTRGWQTWEGGLQVEWGDGVDHHH